MQKITLIVEDHCNLSDVFNRTLALIHHDIKEFSTEDFAFEAESLEYKIPPRKVTR